MSEQDLISDDQLARNHVSAAAASDAPAAGYGARLTAARERAGLGVTDVAASLRLHPNQVRAIEQEDLTRLPELAYVRGFIRSYARVLNIDPAPILSDLNSKLAPTESSVVDGMASTNDYSPVRAASHEHTSRQLVIGIAVVGLIVLGIVGWISTRQVQSPPATPAEPAAAPLPATVNSAMTPSPADAQPASTEAQPAPAVSSANEAVPTLLLRFSGDSWVEVTDANGKILLSQLSSAGAEHALDGELPLTVVIGDAGRTTVEVRGETFNLQPFTRNNVARITVN